MSTVIVDSYTFGALSFRILQATSNCAEHPSVTIPVPPGWVILGGGAFVDWDGPCSPPNSPGNLLTGMFPNGSGTTWTVASKDHIAQSNADIVGYCVIAQLKNGSPIKQSDYKIVSGTSGSAPHPTLQVNLPAEFALVGGGAKANYSGVGNMLYASFPRDGADAWIGSAKDHIQPDPSTITVWAIGLRKSFLNDAHMHISRVSKVSPIANHPHVTLVVPNFHLTGGGARMNWHGVGSLLTASFPEDRETWVAAGKEHIRPERTTVTAWAIGFR